MISATNQPRGAATHPDIVAAPPVWRAATAGAVGGAGPAVRGARPGPTHIVDRSRRHSSDVGGVSAGLRRFCAIWPPHLGGPLQRPSRTAVIPSRVVVLRGDQQKLTPAPTALVIPTTEIH